MRTGPKTILRAATQETEVGDHDFCLSRVFCVWSVSEIVKVLGSYHSDIMVAGQTNSEWSKFNLDDVDV